MDLSENMEMSSKVSIFYLIKYGIYHYHHLYYECDLPMHAFS